MTRFYTIIMVTIFAFNLSAQEIKKVALVIGNNLYANSALKNPVNDANLMTNTLLKLGFEVIQRNNVNKTEMELALYDFSVKAETADILLFYYAGHGIQIGADPYLIPIGADPKNEKGAKFQCINLKEVLQDLEFYPDNLNVIILDACRNNPFRSWKRSSGQTGFKAPPQPQGTLIAYATDEGMTADDNPNSSNGLYTEKLVLELKKPQSIRQVFYNTRDAVAKSSNNNQFPMIWDKTNGDFYLANPKSTNDVSGKRETLPSKAVYNIENQFECDGTWYFNIVPKLMNNGFFRIYKYQYGETNELDIGFIPEIPTEGEFYLGFEMLFNNTLYYNFSIYDEIHLEKNRSYILLGYCSSEQIYNDFQASLMGRKIILKDFVPLDNSKIEIENNEIGIFQMACPWVYIKNRNSYIKIEEIIKNQNSSGLDKYECIVLPKELVSGNKIEIKIQEEKEEISYLDDIYVQVNNEKVYPSNDFLNKNKILGADKNYFELKKDEFIELEFNIPTEVKSEIKLSVKGYYIIMNK